LCNVTTSRLKNGDYDQKQVEFYEIPGYSGARADENAQHTWEYEYVSILKRLETPQLGVRCIFEMACISFLYFYSNDL
jgi:hypothetical protein